MLPIITYLKDDSGIEKIEDFSGFDTGVKEQLEGLLSKKIKFYELMFRKGVISTNAFYFFITWPEEGNDRGITENDIRIVGLSVNDLVNLTKLELMSKKEARLILDWSAGIGHELFA